MRKQYLFLLSLIATIAVMNGYNHGVLDENYLMNTRQEQLTPCTLAMRDLEVMAYYATIESGNAEQGAQVRFYVYYSHDLTICSEPEIWETYVLRKQLEVSDKDPQQSSIEMKRDFYTKPGNSVKTESTVGLGQVHQSKTTFIMTIKSIEELQQSGFLPAPEKIQNLGDGPGERQNIYIQIWWGLDTPDALVRWVDLSLTIETPTFVNGISLDASVIPRQIKKPECTNSCIVRNDNIAIVEFTDSSWTKLTKPVFVSFMPVYIKVYLKDSSSLRQLRPIRITMKSQALQADKLIYSLSSTIGINDITFTWVGKELRITLLGLRSGKTTGLSFLVHAEMGSLSGNQFVVAPSSTIPQSQGGNRRILMERALQEYPEEYVIQAIETSSQDAFEDKQSCVQENTPEECGCTAQDTCKIIVEPNYYLLVIGGIVIISIIGYALYYSQKKKENKGKNYVVKEESKV